MYNMMFAENAVWDGWLMMFDRNTMSCLKGFDEGAI